MFSLISAISLIALLAGQPAESFKFHKTPSISQTISEPAGPTGYVRTHQQERYLNPAQPTQFQAEQQLAKFATKGSEKGTIGTSSIKSEAPIFQQAPEPIQAQPEPIRHAPVAFPTQVAPAELAPIAPLGYPMTYYIVRPIPQPISYQQLRYVQRPEYQYANGALAQHINYEQAAPIAPVYEQATPIGSPEVAPLNVASSPAYVREGTIETSEPGAIKKGKLAKIKGSLEKALGLFSFGSYHVASEEQFLPPQPAIFMQSANQKQQQQQEPIRDFDQQHFAQEQVREQQAPIHQQQQQQHQEQQQQQQEHLNQAGQEIDSNGFRRFSLY